jgi:thymidylate synthase
MAKYDKDYMDFVEKVLLVGDISLNERTGIETVSSFGEQLKFDLSNNTVPLLTIKKMFLKTIVHELLWFVSGSTSVKDLNANGIKIWDAWASESGDLGPIYGKQWRDWNGIDQLQQVIDTIKTNPSDRRMIVSAWNVSEIDQMGLPPCHAFYQFWARPYSKANQEATGRKGQLKIHLYQRSADILVGVPFNISQYSILAHMVAHITGYEATEMIWSVGDAHVYTDQLEGYDILKTRDCDRYDASSILPFPDTIETIDDFKFEDFKFSYVSFDHIPFNVAV